VINATLPPFYPRVRDPFPNVQESVWASQPVWTVAENIAPPHPTRIRSPRRPAHNESLHRLAYFSVRRVVFRLGVS